MGTARAIFEMGMDAKILFDRLEKAQQGETISYGELTSLIGKDVRSDGYGSLSTARRNAQREHRMVFATVRGEGIKLMTDEEIVGTSPSATSRIRRASKRQYERLVCVKDFDALPNEVKISHNASASLMGAINHLAKATSVKKLEGKVEEMQQALPVAKTMALFNGVSE